MVVSESTEGGGNIISWPSWDLSFMSTGGGLGFLGLGPGPGEGLPGPWCVRLFVSRLTNLERGKNIWRADREAWEPLIQPAEGDRACVLLR